MEDTGAILITGGTKGIGFASALELVQIGYRKFILGYHASDEAAKKAKKRLEETEGVKVVLVKGDVADKSTTDAAVQVVEQHFNGSLYAIIHTAGKYLKVDANDPETAAEQYHVMYATAFWRLITKGLPYMESTGHGGRIVTMSTPGVNLAASPRSFYFLPGCAKASMEYMARHFAKELAPKRITVNVVIPGITDTDGWLTATPPVDAVELAKARCPMREVIPPSEVGAAVAFLVSKKARFITGALLPVDGALMFV